MARLSEIRSDIVAPEPAPVLEAEAVESEDVEPGIFDDDDAWDALDLMETSYKILGEVLLLNRMSPGNRMLINNHRDDVKMFIDQFKVPIVVTDAELP